MPDTTYAYGLCRTVTGHAWQYRPEALVRSAVHPGFAWVFTCLTCGCEKHVWYSTRGAIIATRYVHPDGYHTKEDRMTIRHQTLQDLRKEAKHA